MSSLRSFVALIVVLALVEVVSGQSQGGAAHRTSPPATGAGSMPAFTVRLLDVTDDGRPDQLRMGPDGSLQIAVHVSGRVYDVRTQGLPKVLVEDVLATDLSGDGVTDLYLVSRAANVALRGEGLGDFVPATAQLGLSDAGPGVSAELVDLDDDGWDDLLLHNERSDVIFWGEPGGGFRRDEGMPDVVPPEPAARTNPVTTVGGSDAGSGASGSGDDGYGFGVAGSGGGAAGGSWSPQPRPAGDRDPSSAGPAPVLGGVTNALESDVRVGGKETEAGRQFNLIDSLSSKFVNQPVDTDGDVTLQNGQITALRGVFGTSSDASGSFATVSGGTGNTVDAVATYGVVSGGSGNTVTGPGGTVAGGETNIAARNAAIVGGENNRATDDFATVGGGTGNQATMTASTVAGGQVNLATGSRSTVGGGRLNLASATYATVAGGKDNTASAQSASVSGGVSNTASYAGAAVSGGFANTADAIGATVSGGAYHAVSGRYATVSGGGGYLIGPGYDGNVASADHATVGGGARNTASGLRSAIGGGMENEVSGEYSVIGGGSGNEIAYGVLATIAGGQSNKILGSATGDVDRTTIGGGLANQIDAAPGSSVSGGIISGGVGNRIFGNGEYSTIGGGLGNTIESSVSTVSGGWLNTASAIAATVGGGDHNVASLSFATVSGGFGNTAAYDYAVVGGGRFNKSTGSSATVAGGDLNTASGYWSAVPGGQSNTASGARSFAAGTRAKAISIGSFVWGDSFNGDKFSTGTDTFTVYASGGATFYSNTAATMGVTLAPNAGSWSARSDAASKENVDPVDVREVLEKVIALPISTWNYKVQDDRVRHMGPMAQDFHEAFGLGVSDKLIDTVDPDGVALAAIQGLSQVLEEREAEVAALQEQVNRLEQMLAELAR